MNTQIPLVDLISPHLELRNELMDVFRSSLERAMFIGGDDVSDFETDFADFCGVQHCIGVSSGTDAIRFALLAAGIEAGDAVITVPNTFIGTTEAISQAGAVPEFVDIDELTFNIDVNLLTRYLEEDCVADARTGRPVSRRSGRTISAIVPVHLYGQMCEMDALMELAERWHLTLVEDACQAHGAEYLSKSERAWKRAGSLGKAAAFSFYPGKNLGACGEAGAVTTNDTRIAQKIRMLRDHGQREKYYHEIEGFNGRLDAIQAGILRTKLAYLADWNDERRELAENYADLLAGIEGIRLPAVAAQSRPVFHLYVIRVQERQELQRALNRLGIGTGVHYPFPLHLQNAYRDLGYKKGDFPVTEKLADEILSLPIYPYLTRVQQEFVADAIRYFVSERREVRERQTCTLAC